MRQGLLAQLGSSTGTGRERREFTDLFARQVGHLPSKTSKRKERLFELFDLVDDLIEVRPIAGIEFGMEQFAIGTNFKSAATRRNEGERFDALAEFEDLGRQTDGLRRVVSNDAIFDRDFGFHPTRSFPGSGYRAQ